MKQLISLFAIVLLFGCQYRLDIKDDSSPKLRINKLKVTGEGPNQISIDTNYDVKDQYFEVVLRAIRPGGFVANKDLVKSKEGDPYQIESIMVLDSTGGIAVFKSSTEFLNFIDARGFKLVSQLPNEKGNEYTFERKPEIIKSHSYFSVN
jgi:hypothetical protein